MAGAEGHAEALLDALFANAPIGLGFWDTELRYQRINAKLAEINGIAPADHVGRTPSELLGPLGEEVEALLREVVRSGTPVVDREVAGPAPGGEGTQHRLSSYYPVFGPGGEVVGAGGVVRDVTAEHEARADAAAAARRAEFLARVSERLAAVTTDYERTLQEVARIAVPEVADWCTFVVRDPEGGLRVVAVAAADPEQEAVARQLSGLYPPRSDSPAGVARAISTGESELMADVPEELIEAIAYDERHLRVLRELGLRSGLTVPLVAAGQVVGVLTLVYSTSGRRYDADDVMLAESLAARAALSVENARLLAERSHIAHTLQRSLLPPALPEIPGLELAARYRAAGDQNEVGGDFYDAFAAGEGAWSLVIGDVAGKGAEAAAQTSLTRHTLRAAALRAAGPVESLHLLNQALWQQNVAQARFCTVLIARVESDGGGGVHVHLATGGHLAPAVIRAAGDVERPDLRGSIVGGLRSPDFGECRLHLQKGDALVLFTDGVTELRRPGGERVTSGEEDLEAVLREHAGKPADVLVAAVEERAVELQDGVPRDDIALLAVRVV